MLFHSCVIGRIMEYSKYNSEIGAHLPDSFRMELPFHIDSKYRFIVQAQINGQYNMDLIIDNQADNSVKHNDLKMLNAVFWKPFPVATYDMYKHKSRHDLYYFDSFSIASLPFGHLLFHEIKLKNKHTYSILSNTKKNILGRETLHLLNWKFDVDEGKITMFKQKDDVLLIKEARSGYLKIEKGLGVNKNDITFRKMNLSGKFTLDMGSDAELSIGKKLFEQLSKKTPYKKVEGVKGSMYIFENIDVEWNGIVIRNCQANYIEGRFLKNYIGSRLLKRFNFILAYKMDSDGFLSCNDLYLKPRKDFSLIKNTPLIPPFGFVLSKKEGKIIVSAIEIGGLAEKAGLKLQDEIVTIDNGTFDLSIEIIEDNLVKYLLSKENVMIGVKRENIPIKIVLSITNN